MKINKLCYIAFVALLVTGMTACNKEKENENSDNGGKYRVEGVRILIDQDFTYDEMLEDLFGEDPLGMNSDEAIDERTRAINEMRDSIEKEVLNAIEEEGGSNGGGTLGFTTQVITIEYPSVDGRGNKIMLSGNLTLGKINDKYIEVKNLLVNHHPTSLGDKMMSQCKFGNRVVDNLAVVEPHYQGFGSTSNMPQTYLCQKLIGRQCADMIPAAIQVMEQLGVPIADGMGTYIIGYSQGGGNAMATARYLQEEAPAGLRTLANVKKLNCGAGPYDPYATFQHWLTTDTMSFSIVLPMVISGMMEGHSDIMEGIDIESYFSDLYLSTGLVQKIVSRTGSMGDLMVDGSDALASIRFGMAGVMQYYMRFSSIMSDELKNPDSHIRKALEECLKAEVVTDWTPRYPVEIFSAETDPVIPFKANAKPVYDQFKAAGVQVTLQKPLTKDHLLSQVNWQLRINTKKAYK